jgi:hypothetical protein
MAQACYMDEARPEPFDAAAATDLGAVLADLVSALLDCRPQR